jgi:hypothetical protein
MKLAATQPVRALDQAWHELQTAWKVVPPQSFEAMRQVCADGRKALARAHGDDCPLDE